MADNCLSLDSWTSMLTDAFARDNEALTRALQISLSENSTSTSSAVSADSPSPSASSLLRRFVSPEQAVPSPERLDPTGRIGKRKVRPSKRAVTTTYITADPANFMEMVQHATGNRAGGAGPVEPVARSQPRRGAAVEQMLPTLDTSSFLLDQAREDKVDRRFEPVAIEMPAFDFDSLPNFPTLESWNLI
ncbi:calmodulin-binding protein 25-like [Typha angustifolia]|uniref:calmodulin-binding protein 25-like n=1 Tax=Typha angustifolia TaxID=59011 RepID=UPI003C30B45D